MVSRNPAVHANLALGDLANLVRRQIARYTRR
jgi:hypothetical protein